MPTPAPTQHAQVRDRCSGHSARSNTGLAHRHARTSSHSAERLNPCLSGKRVVSHVHVSGNCGWWRSPVAYNGVGLHWNRVPKATSEERLEQLEQALHQAGNALQAANYRITTLETAAGSPATLVTNFICLDGRHACAREAL